MSAPVFRRFLPCSGLHRREIAAEFRGDGSKWALAEGSLGVRVHSFGDSGSISLGYTDEPPGFASRVYRESVTTAHRALGGAATTFTTLVRWPPSGLRSSSGARVVASTLGDPSPSTSREWR